MALQYVMDGEKRTEAVNLNVKTGIALHDLDGLLVAALCVLRLTDDYSDVDKEDKEQALETLLEYGRGAVSDATEGHEEVWKILAEYIFETKEDTTPATEQADQPA
jgi:hypothetical protein